MRRFLTLIAIVAGCFFSSGCNQARKEAGMKESAQTEQMIIALRAAYAAFNRGDIDAAVKALDAHIEWSEPAEFPGGGTYQGREGAKQYLTQSRAAWAEVISEPEEFIPAGDRIVVFVYARVRPKNSNEWQEVRLADVYTFRNGKAIQMRAFADRQEALRWARAEASSR
jgi:ketosteroid isomerase-like protein